MIRRRPIVIASGFAAAALTMTCALGEVGAVEHQHQLGLDPSLGLLKVEGRSVQTSVGAGLHYTYGIDDQWNVMAEGSFNLVTNDIVQELATAEGPPPGRRPRTISHVSAGIGYVIDVIRWVPYVGVLLGGYHFGGGDVGGALFLPGVEVAAGLDYQFNRHWAAGVAIRQHVFVTALDEFPSFTTILLRAQYQWGF